MTVSAGTRLSEPEHLRILALREAGEELRIAIGGLTRPGDILDEHTFRMIHRQALQRRKERALLIVRLPLDGRAVVENNEVLANRFIKETSLILKYEEQHRILYELVLKWNYFCVFDTAFSISR